MGITKAIIFDMDGLMFDTEPISVDAWIEAGKVMGYPITAEMVFKVFGYNPVGVSQYWRDVFGDGFDTERAMDFRIDYIQNYALENGVKKKPGLVALLDYLKENDYRFTIASATQRAVVERFIGIAGIADYFDEVVGGDDIVNGKPAPDIYLKAGEKLGIAPEHCMVLEDSPAGIEAGYRAGMRPVMIPDMITADEKTESRLYAKLTSLEEVIGLLKQEK